MGHQTSLRRFRNKTHGRAEWAANCVRIQQQRSLMRISFSGWQSAACRIRRRWLERRCRLLEGGKPRVHKSSTKVPNLGSTVGKLGDLGATKEELLNYGLAINPSMSACTQGAI